MDRNTVTVQYTIDRCCTVGRYIVQINLEIYWQRGRRSEGKRNYLQRTSKLCHIKIKIEQLTIDNPKQFNNYCWSFLNITVCSSNIGDSDLKKFPLNLGCLSGNTGLFDKTSMCVALCARPPPLPPPVQTFSSSYQNLATLNLTFPCKLTSVFDNF